MITAARPDQSLITSSAGGNHRLYSAQVNRTDRLYALVDELRRVSPRTRSATWLAGRFEVSVRTIERDLDALVVESGRIDRQWVIPGTRAVRY